MTVLPPEEPADRVEHVDIDQYPEGERRTVVVEDRATAQTAYTFRITQIIWLLFGILEGLILIRIVLKLLAANPASPFAAFIYGITQPFLLPFQGLFGTPAAGGMVLEISSIVAVFIYWLIAWVIVKILWVVLYRPATRNVSTVDRDRRY